MRPCLISRSIPWARAVAYAKANPKQQSTDEVRTKVSLTDSAQLYAWNVLQNEKCFRISGTEIVVDGGWFFAATYLTNERCRHTLQLLSAKDKVEHVLDDVLKHFR
jgi:hypothetical protein